MIEFRSALGGRYDCVEDLLNLKDAAMAINDFFLDSGKDFVITGCKRTAHGYTDGFVWLDERIRYVEAANIDADDVWIVGTDDEGVTVDYADGVSSYPVSYILGAEYAASGDADLDMQAEDGKFPTLVDFFSTYVVAKNSDELQEIETNSGFGMASFKNGCTFRVGVDDNSFHVEYDKSKKRFSIIFLNSDNTEYSRYYIDQNSTAITFFKNNEIVWQIGGELGELSINNMRVHNFNDNSTLEVKEYSDMSEIMVDGTDLEDIFASTIHHQDTGWIYPIDSETNSPIMDLKIRQQKNRVFIQGILPKRYIMGADNANNVDPSSSIANSSYLDVIFPEGDVAGATCTVIKTHVKLPDSISAPDSTRIAGCVLSSDTLIQNAQMMCNVELHVGADKFLYISGKPRCMVWREGGPRISFEYLVD